MNPFDEAVWHVRARLTASAGLTTVVAGRVVAGVAPEGMPRPLVLIQPYGDAADVNYNGGVRAVTEVLLSVRLVSVGGDVPQLRTAVTALDTALHGTGGNTPAASISTCYRLRAVDLTEPAPGGDVRYRGGIYRLMVASA